MIVVDPRFPDASIAYSCHVENVQGVEEPGLNIIFGRGQQQSICLRDTNIYELICVLLGKVESKPDLYHLDELIKEFQIDVSKLVDNAMAIAKHCKMAQHRQIQDLTMPIVHRKIQGIDCTQEESAIIKRYFDFFSPAEAANYRGVAQHFQMELAEWFDEKEQGLRE